MSAKVCEVLLLHLPSKETSGGLGEELFAGAHDVFVAFSYEDDAADGVTCGDDGVDDLGTGNIRLFVHDGDFTPVFGVQAFGFPVIDHAFQLMADHFSNEFFASWSGSGDYLVVIGDAGEHACGLGKGFGVFFGKNAQLSDWGVLFQDNLTFPVGEDFKRGAFFDSQGPADFLWYDYPAQVVCLCQSGAKKFCEVPKSIENTRFFSIWDFQKCEQADQ